MLRSIPRALSPATSLGSVRAHNYSASGSLFVYVHQNSWLNDLICARNIIRGARFYSSTQALLKFSLNDTDVEEAFVKGSGPGGQKINKVRNCVQLKHLPTGIMVSCQDGRTLGANRAIARKQLEKKVEFATLGADSRLGKAIKKKQKQKQKSKQRARLKYHSDPVDSGSLDNVVDDEDDIRQPMKQEQTVRVASAPSMNENQHPRRISGVQNAGIGVIDYDSDEDDGEEEEEDDDEDERGSEEDNKKS